MKRDSTSFALNFREWQTSRGLRHRMLICMAIFFTLCLSTGAVAQTIVTGTVKDESGNGIRDVTIAVKGGRVNSTTDHAGNYSISVPNLNSTLLFTYVGYGSVEQPLKGRRDVSVVMLKRDEQLDQVIVTGYSRQRKRDITGSVSVVNIGEMQDQPVVSVGQALQGMASGVNVIAPGSPGAAAQIRIRGISSFGNTEPLVIVDGIEQSLTHINPEDIESLQVLKDAGAAAIYGVRGSNGVIIVTTKKGRNGPPVVSYDVNYRHNFPLQGNVWDLMNTTDYAKVYNIGYPLNDLFQNGIPDYTYRGPSGAGAANEGDAVVDPALYFYEKRNTGRNYIIQGVNKDREDWFHHLFKPAGTIDMNLSVSGGTSTAKYMLGLGYTDQNGTMIESNYKRYSIRLNTEFNVAKGITIGENVNVRYRQTVPTDGNISATYSQMPSTPLKDIMGNWAGTFGGPALGTSTNPVALQHRNALKDVINDWDIAGIVYMQADFLKHFSARTAFGVNFNNGYNFNYTGTQVENAETNTNFNSLTIGNEYSSRRTFTNTLTYSQEFGRHRVTALGGMEAIKTTNRGVSGSVNGFFIDEITYLDLDNGTQNLLSTSSVSAEALYSLFADVDYVFDDKYIIGATVRRDGSSRFGANKRFGVFPSVSAGWRISSEKFMESVTWIDNLLVRGSYGILGSQNDVSLTNAYSLYSSGLGTTNYDIRGTSTSTVQGFAQSQIGNPFTGWEEDKVTNIGIDVTLFNNKLDLSFEYYKKAIQGLLFAEPLPAVIQGGASAPTINIGDIQNVGYDVSVRYRNRISDNLRYNVGFNLTTYRNEVVDIPEPGYFQAGSQDQGFLVRNEEGHPVSAFYGYKIIGLFNSAEEVTGAPTQTAAAPGRFRYQDTNGDKAITSEDQVFLGNPNPDFTYGLTLGLEYKKFSFSALLYGSQGNEIYNYSRERLDFFQKYGGGKSNRLKNAWTPQNTNTNIPKIETATTFSTNGVPTSYFVEDGSYLKLRSITLGYNLDASFMKKMGINKFRVYLQGANLFNITKYSGLDPELTGGPSAFGIDTGHYPTAETSVVFGINVTF
jgi:TonB-linked SusC/RagA family outer membrane protein